MIHGYDVNKIINACKLELAIPGTIQKAMH